MNDYNKHKDEELKRIKEIQERKKKYNLPDVIILNSYVDSDTEDDIVRRVTFSSDTT